jgi:hypothetical protein
MSDDSDLAKVGLEVRAIQDVGNEVCTSGRTRHVASLIAFCFYGRGFNWLTSFCNIFAVSVSLSIASATRATTP